MIVSGDHVRISEVIDTLAHDTRKLIKDAVEISYFSRGSWSLDSVLNMPPLVRDMETEFINSRLEIASKSSFPVY